MSDLSDAIDTYHDLLTDSLAAVSQEQMDTLLRQRGLYFGDRPLCTVLRPRFFTPSQYQFLQDRIRLLMQAFDRAYRAALSDPVLRAQFRLEPWEEEVVQWDPGIREPSPLGRLDAFYQTDRDELWFTEYNAEVPAAPSYNDHLTEVFYSLPIMRKFSRRFELRPLPVQRNVVHALLETFYHWPGRTDDPRIAILDWKEVPTYSEFVLMNQYFQSMGLSSRIIDPREMTYENGRLMAGDYHVTLIYKRVLISELIKREGLNSPVVEAVRDGAACMVNPFRCVVLYKKASFAVLSDERNAEIFSDSEQEAIDSHIPWTRLVEERTTIHRNRPVDLIPYIVKYKERFVLKPNDDYGGRGIVLGWKANDEEWAVAVRNALINPYVVQERVRLPTEPFPSLVDGHVLLGDRMLDTAPYVFYGSFVDGCLTRLSTADLLNVTAGGGSTVPTFVVARR